MSKTKARLFVGSVAGVVALGVGRGAALAAQSSAAPPVNVQTADATQSTTGMPGMTQNSMLSGPSTNYRTSVRLHSMPEGTVTVQQRGTGLEATIAALGLTPGSSHIAEITLGDGQPPIVFSQFTASATGQVNTTVSSIEPVTGPLPQDATFRVDLSTSPAQPIATARLRSYGFNDVSPLEAVDPSGEGHLSGHARLAYDSHNQTLTVTIDATGFVPDTSHAAHVHMGSCAAQGAPIVMLSDLHADGRARIDQTDVVHDLASFNAPAAGWYLNIHQGSSSTILDAQGQPTTQFRPLLCANLPASSSASPPPPSQRQPVPPSSHRLARPVRPQPMHF